MDRILLSAALLVGALLLIAAAHAEEVVFTEAPPYASDAEIARRMGRPAGKPMELSIDLPREIFFLHVPPEMPEGGYGVLVFVPPWSRAVLPRGWDKPLDHHGMIFVTAARSGNEERTDARRAPLALIAAANVMKRYQINPDHIFVGGFSGGSRVAERLAVAYPDLFRGAMLESGSDRVNENGLPLPPPDLWRRAQESSHLVFITGERDAINVGLDKDSMRSLRENCMFRFDSQQVPWLGHDVLPAAAFEAVLQSLLDPPPLDEKTLTDCRGAS